MMMHRPPRMRQGCCLPLVLLISLIISDHVCTAFPSKLISPGDLHCVSVDGPLDLVLRIEVETPDMANVDSDPGLEPLRLTVNTVPANRISDTDLHHAPIRDRLKPLSEKLHNIKAEFPFKFEAGGVANVCLKSSAKKPMIYGLRITSNEELPNEVKEEEKADLNMHLSHMERELQRITRALTYVLKEADVNKDQDELFHKQTLALHESTTFWPIVQVCVLLSTGFAQARHIVKFFKSRRII